ncbi:hypothetical protein C8E01_10241 [Pontibacter virosus]|uniref:Uncharacterized protein n=1 Tax=Pontibacter virosus TaxID=1765052 RepID=A0A2U1B2F7_9BACT|nr:hypothetical protein C8E01_10241 [Pontibacter virosus]
MGYAWPHEVIARYIIATIYVNWQPETEGNPQGVLYKGSNPLDSLYFGAFRTS